jgi:hypothetical protein
MPHDPFAIPMIFLRVAWMTRYQGIGSGDTPVGGGAYIAEHGFGHEIFNFQQFQGAMYGYGQPPGRKDKWSDAKINLTRLGADAEDKSVSGVLAVWMATWPMGGGFIVGWYKNATLFRDWQSPPAGSARTHAGTDCGYYVTAKSEDVVLLAPDERNFPVPQQEKGGFGQSNIWYADDPEQHRQFRENVLRYVDSRQLPHTAGDLPPPHQPDPLLRQKVEKIAVETTTKHFTRLGYTVDSVEQDNIGWDLNAVSGKRELKLEVKGLSGEQIVVELTPNEYKAMKTHTASYRICVVTNALAEPSLAVFGYTPDSGKWETAEGRVLNLQEIIAVRCTAM